MTLHTLIAGILNMLSRKTVALTARLLSIRTQLHAH